MKKLLMGLATVASAGFIASSPAQAASVISCGSSSTNACQINFTENSTGGFGSYLDSFVDVTPFSDIYEFTISKDGVLAIGLTTSGPAEETDIDFILTNLTTGANVFVASLNQTQGDPNEQYALTTGLAAGTYRIRLDGVAGGPNFISTAYTGSLAFTAVPEPATWAMMLAGFGAIGYSIRRRKAHRLVQAV